MQRPGMIFDIKKYTIHDGPGIRTTIFLKGCPLHCQWCQNPESMSFRPERLDRPSRHFYVNSPWVTDRMTIGKLISVNRIIDEIMKDTVFYKASGGGITISGGEPLAQIDFVDSLLKVCKKNRLHTVIDTSGYADWACFEKIRRQTDLFLYDMKIFDRKAHIKYTGVDNTIIFENLEKLIATRAKIAIRFPLIPQVTDAVANMRAIGNFLSKNKIREIDILPFNFLCYEKYNRIGKRYPFRSSRTTRSRIESTVKEFSKSGLSAKIEGWA
ncbi:hypothetical protein A2Y85_05345 [candidate division WOR-3 bacterium RBG_13_43_14]|uniref:Radical SAM core domain-containing protein n=1 Tax=candidate division WOR-3 bacterium RBG_13_43_14 TaxID=1802590 RepID=A0A1F4U1P3_UNCW3|nr:MAG: hypothetical protein A2Y85_05345 [candidate division WOR-3 bacterium RBG_13_43_14]